MRARISKRTFLQWGLAAPLLAHASRPNNPITPPLANPTPQKKLAVVLGGGSARGFAHIGVIKALEAHGIKPDLIVGCSAGSLVGAFWAAGFSGAQMQALAEKVRDDEVIDLITGSRELGMVTGLAIQNFVNSALKNRPIEALETPFTAVATRFPRGDLALFQSGNTGFAVRASCSIPGIFIPAEMAGEQYLDGGLVSPVPVATARKLGADMVVAVDVGGADPGSSSAAKGGLFELLQRSFEIMGQALRKQETAGADLMIKPDVLRVSSSDFASRKILIEAGEMAGNRLAPVILAKLAQKIRR